MNDNTRDTDIDYNQISSYLDERLSPPERAAFEAAMAESPRIAAETEAYAIIREELSTMGDIEPPDGLHDSLMAYVTANRHTAVIRRYDFRSLAYAAASVLLLLVLIGGVSLGVASLGGFGGGSTNGRIGIYTADSTAMMDTMDGGAAEQNAVDAKSWEYGTVMEDSDTEMDEETEAESGEGTGEAFLYSGLEIYTETTQDAPADSSANMVAGESTGASPVTGGAALAEAVDMDVIDAHITIEVTDISAVLAVIDGLAGYNASANVESSGGEPAYAYISRAVPQEDHTAVLEALRLLGGVQRENQYRSSLLYDYNDAVAAYNAKAAEYDRLLTLLALAEDYDDILSIQDYLNNCINQMENYRASISTMDSGAAYATVYITLELDDDGVEAVEPGFVERVKSAWNGSVSLLLKVFEYAAYGLAWIALPASAAAILAIIGRAVYRRRKGGRHD